MIELITTGRKYHPGYEMPLWHNPQEVFSPEIGVGMRFRLVLVETGAGIVRLGERRESFIAPSLFCLNEADSPELVRSLELQAQALYFHPAAINSVFDFDNVRRGEGFSVTEGQDLHCLVPFVQRNPGYAGQLHIGPASARRISLLFNAVSQELAQQKDASWPCRSRSFFLEALFLVERVFSLPLASQESVLAESLYDVDPIILHLHTHYQEKVTITDLVRRFHTNRTTLEQRFREATGLPVMTYLTQLRVRLAALMLRDTELPVSEVMWRVGFRDSTHFGRTFRKHTAQSPSEYREQYCWMLRQ
jgi:AraC-like DNA-binding protein